MKSDDFLSDDERLWIGHIKATDGGVSLLKWLDLREAAVDRQFLATKAEELNLPTIAALQAKKHAYREIRDLITFEGEEDDEGTRETRFAVG